MIVLEGVIDLDACVRDAGHPTRLRASFDHGDHIHCDADSRQPLEEAGVVTRIGDAYELSPPARVMLRHFTVAQGLLVDGELIERRRVKQLSARPNNRCS